MKLADIPKTFRLTELVKGFPPHHFNEKENEHYFSGLLICSIMTQMEYLRIDEVNSLSCTNL